MNNLVNKLSRTFNLDPVETQIFIDFYNHHYDKYDNNIYRYIESRITHWVNYTNGGWFQNRINIALDHLEQLLKGNERIILVDIGFSVPYIYSRKSLLNNERLSCVFIDKYHSSKIFLDGLEKTIPNIQNRKNDICLIADIENDSDRDKIISAISTMDKVDSSKIIVVASEVLEHLSYPDMCWNMMFELCRIGNTSSAYVTLPVGEKIPSHTLEFNNERDVKNYIRQYASIVKDIMLSPPNDSNVSKHLEQCYCAYVDIYSGKEA